MALDSGNDPNPYWTALWGLTGAAFILAAIVALQAAYYHLEAGEIERKVISQAPEELTQLRSKQLAELNSYRWVSETEGVVGIPIDRAMELVAREAGATAGD
ncbi:MAG: hypothetical protein HKN20_12975 [Gemmatimonadetes bacterium]|nr:hypothetical protein [Gemmatimonadota bacterium]